MVLCFLMGRSSQQVTVRDIQPVRYHQGTKVHMLMFYEKMNPPETMRENLESDFLQDESSDETMSTTL